MSDEVDYEKTVKGRFSELRPSAGGRLMTEWQLTDTKLVDAVRITVPPSNVVPIVFVPGIMGSNLCDADGKPVWLLDSFGSVPVGLAMKWLRKDAGARQSLLHPARTKVYRLGAVPTDPSVTGLSRVDYLARGWGEVSQASYHNFLVWIDKKMNAERDPASWDDFTNDAVNSDASPAGKLLRKLSPGLVMSMHNLPPVAEAGARADPITSNELLKRSRSTYPIYAFGYNWLDSNSLAAESLKERINSVIAENRRPGTTCSQVIVVTHSMGGLVARACSQLSGMSGKIIGIVHGVMPATGAAVAYRRCKVGMRDEDFKAGLVIGSNGKAVTAVFAQAPGALQLLPSEDYGPGWLNLKDQTGRAIASLPVADPYEEIYLEREKWWGLIREDWLKPKGGKPIKWSIFALNIKIAREFHRGISGKYHTNTYVFYGGGPLKQSFAKIGWVINKGALSKSNDVTSIIDIPSLGHTDVGTDGAHDLYVGRTKTTGGLNSAELWDIRCAKQDSSGDGTVPAHSGRDPRHSGGRNIIQQFELPGIEHEPAYRDYPIAQQVAYYAITKLAALAEIK
jgi:hypothetical protein